MKLGLVTFHRDNESFTKSFSNLAKELQRHVEEIEIFVFVDKKDEQKKKIAELPFSQIEMPNTTKYKRILHLLEISSMDYFLFVDNDIDSDIRNTIYFVKKMEQSNASIGWGKIMAQKDTTFIGKVVAVDKLISHNFIRPLLWKLNVGISVPGQCFMIKVQDFENKINHFDTFLDDISFGLVVQMEKMPYFIDQAVLGYEEPHISMKALLTQRKRWAHGFMSIYWNMMQSTEARLYLNIHGFAYHGSWIVIWGIFVALALFNVKLAITYMMLMLLVICGKRMNLLVPAIMYTFLFPVLHMQWLKSCRINYKEYKRSLKNANE